MSKSKPVLLWKAPLAPKPEPVATLTYGDQSYEIPLTLLHWLSGWVAIGAKGTCVQDAISVSNTQNALRNLHLQMSEDANPLTEREKEFYTSNGIPIDLNFTEVVDYHDK